MKPEQSEYLFVETLFKESVLESRAEKLDDIQVQKMTGDASTRRYYRVICCKSQRAFVVCLDHPSSQDENNFTSIQKILTKHGCRVPRIYDQKLEKGYLLEEDLGNKTFLSALAHSTSEKEERELYQKALSELIKIHQIEPDLYPDAVFNSYAFDVKKLMQEIRMTHEYFLQGYLQAEISVVDARILEEHFSEISREINTQKMILTHRDYHSRNIMIKDDNLYIIDFQDARLGIPQYDLVSLLEDCYYAISKENKEALKQQYWDQYLSNSGLGQSREEFDYYYDLMAIQRTYKAIGSFAFIYQTRGDTRYLKYIGAAFERFRHLLLKKNYISLSKTISKYFYES